MLIVIKFVVYFRASSGINRIDSSLVTNIGLGLVVIGAILLFLFIIDFMVNRRKNPDNSTLVVLDKKKKENGLFKLLEAVEKSLLASSVEQYGL